MSKHSPPLIHFQHVTLSKEMQLSTLLGYKQSFKAESSWPCHYWHMCIEPHITQPAKARSKQRRWMLPLIHIDVLQSIGTLPSFLSCSCVYELFQASLTFLTKITAPRCCTEVWMHICSKWNQTHGPLSWKFKASSIASLLKYDTADTAMPMQSNCNYSISAVFNRL